MWWYVIQLICNHLCQERENEDAVPCLSKMYIVHAHSHTRPIFFVGHRSPFFVVCWAVVSYSRRNAIDKYYAPPPQTMKKNLSLGDQRCQKRVYVHTAQYTPNIYSEKCVLLQTGCLCVNCIYLIIFCMPTMLYNSNFLFSDPPPKKIDIVILPKTQVKRGERENDLSCSIYALTQAHTVQCRSLMA